MTTLRMFAVLSCVFVAFVCEVNGQLQTTYVGGLNISLPGFSNIYEHPGWTDPAERYSLLLSTFNAAPYTIDTSFFLEYIGKYLSNLGNFVPTEIYDQFNWPREPSQTPGDVFGFPTITQPDGFLPPGKNNGTVYVTDIRDLNNPVTFDLIRDPANPDPVLWFYHRAIWKDVDEDGLKDVITCRVSQTGADEYTTEMVWGRQPSSAPLTQPWAITVINTDICGTMQYEATLDVPALGPTYALFTVGYFTNILAVHWSTASDGSWANPVDIQTRTIDTGHQFFDLAIDDINQDGRLDLLVTWNAEVNGSFVAYEIPDDFRSDPYPVHVLASGFSARSGMGGAGTPGSGQTFYPGPDTSVKPWILLSGDDDGRTYHLTPQTQDTADWAYDLVTIRDEGPGNIMGRPSAMDVDGDGYAEVFIPVYYANMLQVYTFKP